LNKKSLSFGVVWDSGVVAPPFGLTATAQATGGLR
jgi:hypothetical protein